MSDRVEGLRRKVKEILSRSWNWNAWHEAIETALAEPEDDKRLICVDTYNIIEYLLPRSLVEEQYPTALDLALLLVFKPDAAKPFILPPHQRELRSLSEVWHEQARMAGRKLEVLKSVLEEFQRRIEELRAGQDEGSIEDFIQFILRERSTFFGAVFGPKTRRDRAMTELARPLDIPTLESLGLAGWQYHPSPDRIEELYEELAKIQVTRHGGPASHRVDAHALHLLELLNKALPDRYLILSTPSGKIWRALAQIRQKEPDALFKDKVPLVQRPEVILVHRLLQDSRQEGADGERNLSLREELVLEKERGESLRDLRRRLEQEIWRYLEQEDLERIDLEEVEKLVSHLDEGLKELSSMLHDQQRLQRIQLAIDSSEGGGDLLAQFQAAIRDSGKREELREILERRMGELLTQVRDLEQKLSLTAITPEPTLQFEFEEDAPFNAARGILRSRPGGAVYSIHFQSDTVEGYLHQIQASLKELDQARDPDEEKAIRLQLQGIMYQCEVRLRRDPELYLLLASVFSSRQMWFQAYDAADQGLKRLWRDGPWKPSDPLPDLATASATTELLLLRAAALRNWTLDSHADLKAVAAGFLRRAAGYIREALASQQQWASILRYYPDRDPRLLRELATLYGNAREVGIDLEIDPADLRLLGIPNEAQPDLLDLFLGFARAAWEQAQHDGELQAYYENSLLYALTQKDHPEDDALRFELARSLESRKELAEDPNLQDTLAWHSFRVALRLKAAGRPYREPLMSARERIESAWQSVKKDHAYYKQVFLRHRVEILRECKRSLRGRGRSRRKPKSPPPA